MQFKVGLCTLISPLDKMPRASRLCTLFVVFDFFWSNNVWQILHIRYSYVFSDPRCMNFRLWNIRQCHSYHPLRMWYASGKEWVLDFLIRLMHQIAFSNCFCDHAPLMKVYFLTEIWLYWYTIVEFGRANRCHRTNRISFFKQGWRFKKIVTTMSDIASSPRRPKLLLLAFQVEDYLRFLCNRDWLACLDLLAELDWQIHGAADFFPEERVKGEGMFDSTLLMARRSSLIMPESSLRYLYLPLLKAITGLEFCTHSYFGLPVGLHRLRISKVYK